ncbi:MAG: hypothetical protein BWY93_02278 [Euryarchaeota archaeon ADurb.BinA087]|nr:MAG: hypothetical protein BWY93_02278 [Euryarchaeota archaeon ADurb.BinA087]
MAVSAAVRVIPKPPVAICARKTRTVGFSWNWRIASSLPAEVTPPTRVTWLIPLLVSLSEIALISGIKRAKITTFLPASIRPSRVSSRASSFSVPMGATSPPGVGMKPPVICCNLSICVSMMGAVTVPFPTFSNASCAMVS